MLRWLPALLAVALLPLAILIGISLVSDEATLNAPTSEAVPPHESVPAATQGIEDAPYIEYHG